MKNIKRLLLINILAFLLAFIIMLVLYVQNPSYKEIKLYTSFLYLTGVTPFCLYLIWFSLLYKTKLDIVSNVTITLSLLLYSIFIIVIFDSINTFESYNRMFIMVSMILTSIILLLVTFDKLNKKYTTFQFIDFIIMLINNILLIIYLYSSNINNSIIEKSLIIGLGVSFLITSYLNIVGISNHHNTSNDYLNKKLLLYDDIMIKVSGDSKDTYL